MLQYIFSTTPILLSTYVSSCIDNMVSSAGVNMILAFLKKDIISGAKQLLWTGRVSDVHRRNENMSWRIVNAECKTRYISNEMEKRIYDENME